MNPGQDHLRAHPLHVNKGKRIFDGFMYTASIIGPLIIVPQIIQVWIYQNVEGVSLLTWSLLGLGSFMWFIYGLIHNEKPLAISNFLIATCDLLVVIGVLINR